MAVTIAGFGSETVTMKAAIDFGMADFLRVVKNLAPSVSHGANGPASEEPCQDFELFQQWLARLELGDANIDQLMKVVPSVSLETNHGPLYGMKRFMAANSEEDCNVRKSDFLVFGHGANGDLIVVDVRDGSGVTGWLPLGRIFDMHAEEIRENFAPANRTLGEFLLDSEERWRLVPKDWYAAKRK